VVYKWTAGLFLKFNTKSGNKKNYTEKKKKALHVGRGQGVVSRLKEEHQAK